MSSNGVPYQAYRSKRHSRTPSSVGLPSPGPSSPAIAPDVQPSYPTPSSPPMTPASPPARSPPPIAVSPPPPATSPPLPAAPDAPLLHPAPPPALAARATSTFRRVPLRAVSATNANTPSTPSPLRPTNTHLRTISLSAAPPPPPPKDATPPRAARLSSYFSTASNGSQSTPTTPLRGGSPLPAPSPLPSELGLGSPAPRTPVRVLSPAATDLGSPGPRTPMRPFSPSTPTSTLSPAPQPPPSARRVSTASTASATVRAPAPYRPGFQPRGVYRPRTDEFTAARAQRRTVGRVERARLERRLEKLIALHFGDGAEGKGAAEKPAEKPAEKARPGPSALGSVRRMSSLWDLGGVAADVWRGGGPAPGASKTDVRAAEQAIAPWAPDDSAAACFACGAAFHALTNRRHHCRLCGRLVCALPPRRPARPVACSVLFVVDRDVDPEGRIEEVKEGVDYGVRRRTASSAGKEGEEDKFLKGVRICRECRPVLLRKQFARESAQTPLFGRLYALLLALEAEIAAQLPPFRELMFALAAPPAEGAPPLGQGEKDAAAAARRRLVAAFGQYDACARRVRALPAEKGGSQARVQAAVVARANAFLQENMVPLQSIPSGVAKPKRANGAADSANGGADGGEDARAEDQAAHAALQPLLEQEALLEAFVEQAVAGRKFEDARTLRANLAEIRGEIARVAQAGA